MFNNISTFFSDLVTPPTQRIKFLTTFVVLIVPADGSEPRLEHVRTVNVSLDGKADRHLVYAPDMRRYWGTGRGWEFRDMIRIEIKDHSVPELNACYYGFKSFALDDLPLSHYGSMIYGDACLARMAPERFDARGNRIVRLGDADHVDYENQLSRFAVYEDMPKEALDPRFWKLMVQQLNEI